MSNEPQQRGKGRADRLVVYRESGMASEAELAGLIRTTLSPLAHQPGMARVLAEGTAPLHDPTCRPEAQRFNLHGLSAVLFSEGDTFHLLCLGSAAIANVDDEDNAFTNLFVDVVTALRPRHLHVAYHARLIRSLDYSGDIYRALSRNVDLIFLGMESCDLDTEEGRMRWHMYTMFSAMERDAIVKRLMSGKANKIYTGQWPFSHEALPPGYRILNDRIAIDPDQVEVVRDALHVLGDHSLSTEDATESIGRLGLSSPKLRRLHGPDATYADSRYSTAVRKRFLKRLEVYESGTLAVRIRNPLKGVDSFAGVEIERSDSKDAGAMVLTWQVEVPLGGWVPQTVIDNIRTRPKEKCGAKPGPPTRMALTGRRPWDVDDWTMRLVSGGGSTKRYIWLTRTAKAGTGAESMSSAKDERCASFRTREFIPSVFNAALAALRDGVEGSLVDGVLPFATGHRIRVSVDRRSLQLATLRRERDDANRLYQQARENANGSDNPVMRDDYLADSIRYLDERQRVEAQIEDIPPMPTGPPALDEAFACSVDAIAHALSTLGTKVIIPAKLAKLLNEVLVIKAVHLNLPAPTATVEFVLRLPHNNHVLQLGPIQAHVPTANQEDCLPPELTPDYGWHVLNSDDSLEAIASFLGVEERKVIIRATRDLEPHGLARRAARVVVCSEMRPLRRALARSYYGTPADELDPRYIERCRQVYADLENQWGHRGTYAVSAMMRKLVLATIREAGGRINQADLRERLRSVLVSPNNLVIEMSGERYVRGDSGPVWPALLQTTAAPGAKTPLRSRWISLIPCPHCGGWASHLVRVPEVPETLLCPDCLRAPSSDSPVYPSEYLHVDDLPIWAHERLRWEDSTGQPLSPPKPAIAHE